MSQQLKEKLILVAAIVVAILIIIAAVIALIAYGTYKSGKDWPWKQTHKNF